MGERASDDLRAAEHADAARIAAGNLTGIICMSGAMASFACGDTLMKLAAGPLPTSELLFIRGMCVTTVSVIAALWLGAFTELRAAMSTAMALRAASSAERAFRPSPCGELGLAHRSSESAIAARASGSTGVVAAWSR